MISNKNKYQSGAKAKSIIAALMMFLLLFLTTANSFVFSGDDSSVLMTAQGEDSETMPGSPGGPDEKSSNGPVSVSEEYIHGHIEPDESFLSKKLFTHLITASEKIELVHFELLSPPPEC